MDKEKYDPRKSAKIENAVATILQNFTRPEAGYNTLKIEEVLEKLGWKNNVATRATAKAMLGLAEARSKESAGTGIFMTREEYKKFVKETKKKKGK